MRSSVSLQRTAFQKYGPTVLKVIVLGLAPRVQLFAVGLGVFRDVFKVYYDPLGGRDHPLIRGGVAILFLEGTELVVNSGECLRFTGLRAVLGTRASGAMLAQW